MSHEMLCDSIVAECEHRAAIRQRRIRIELFKADRERFAREHLRSSK